MENRQYRRKFALLSGAAVLALALTAGAALRAALPAAVTAESTAQVPVLSEDGEQKLIALTFDDGPRRSTTTALLDGLAPLRGKRHVLLEVDGGNERARRLYASSGFTVRRLVEYYSLPLLQAAPSGA